MAARVAREPSRTQLRPEVLTVHRRRLIRRWAPVLVLGLVALVTMAVTFQCRDSTVRTTQSFTVWYCPALCAPYMVEVHGTFDMHGHGHWNLYTNAASSHIHEYEQSLVIDNFNEGGSFPFGLNLGMSVDVSSNTEGELDMLVLDGPCNPAAFPGEWLRSCLRFEGTIGLGPEGGSGMNHYGVAATGNVVCPCSIAFDIPWFKKA